MKIIINYDSEKDEMYNAKCALKSVDLNIAIHDALQAIRARLKYGEDVTEIEEQTLEKIRSILAEHYIEG